MDRQMTLDGGETEPWKNRQLMHDLWNQHEVPEMAEILECSQATIRRFLDRHGVKKQEREKIPPAYHTRTDGYEMVMDGNQGVLVHRLVAVSEWGFETVTSAEAIHHRNTHKWDNRPENLLPCETHAKHMREHARPKPADDQDDLDSYPSNGEIARESETDEAQSSLTDFC